MKFFAFIMAFLLLALSLLPCADDDFGSNESTIVATIKQAGQHSVPEADHCSPFCQCACCAGFSISHSITRVEFIRVYTSLPFFVFSSLKEKGVALPIWQPPQII